MSVLHAFTTGIKRATAEFRMVLVLYVINLLAALSLALAFRSVLESGLGASLARSELMDGISYPVLQEFLGQHMEEVSVVFRQMVWLTLLYILVNTALAGGILARIRDKELVFSFREFFTGCGTYFLRFFRLSLLFGVILILLAFVLMVLLGALFEATVANASSEITWISWFSVVIILFLFPIMVVIVIADYAKVSTVVTNTHAMVRAAWRSTKFVFRHFFRVIGLQFLMLLVPIVLFAIYLWLDLSIGMTSIGTIWLMLFLQQLFILSRAWSRVFFFSGELELFEDLRISQ